MFSFIMCIGIVALSGWFLNKLFGKIGSWIFINALLLGVGVASSSFVMVSFSLLSQIGWVIVLACHVENNAELKREIKKQNDKQTAYEKEFGVIEYKEK